MSTPTALDLMVAQYTAAKGLGIDFLGKTPMDAAQQAYREGFTAAVVLAATTAKGAESNEFPAKAAGMRLLAELLSWTVHGEARE